MLGLAVALLMATDWPEALEGVFALGEATAGAVDMIWAGWSGFGGTGVSG
jgi:hypothetical protein